MFFFGGGSSGEIIECGSKRTGKRASVPRFFETGVQCAPKDGANPKLTISQELKLVGFLNNRQRTNYSFAEQSTARIAI